MVKCKVNDLNATFGPLVQRLERIIRIGFRKEGIPYEKYKENGNDNSCNNNDFYDDQYY